MQPDNFTPLRQCPVGGDRERRARGLVCEGIHIYIKNSCPFSSSAPQKCCLQQRDLVRQVFSRVARYKPSTGGHPRCELPIHCLHSIDGHPPTTSPVFWGQERGKISQQSAQTKCNIPISSTESWKNGALTLFFFSPLPYFFRWHNGGIPDSRVQTPHYIGSPRNIGSGWTHNNSEIRNFLKRVWDDFHDWLFLLFLSFFFFLTCSPFSCSNEWKRALIFLFWVTQDSRCFIKRVLSTLCLQYTILLLWNTIVALLKSNYW